MLRRWRTFYGSDPLHLLALLGCFGLAGYAALQAQRAPAAGRMLLWFAGAVVGHDLVLFPLYALADRSVSSAVRRPDTGVAGRRSVNYVRVPALLSGLLFLMFWPLITRHSQPTYRFATGLGTTVYLGRWLLLSGSAFLLSGLLWAVRAGRRRA